MPCVGHGGRLVQTDIAVRRVFVYSLQSAVGKQTQVQSKFVEFSVFGLPFQTQEVYRLLLTVPIGIFLLVILRNVVGMRTFGTFMPVLIALAFRETQLFWGAILFTSVVAIGLLVRFYLEQLKLLLVPRLASVVIVVILVMTVISVISHKLGFDRGLSVALFPIVILAMTIERMTVIWDEKGPKEALVQAVGSFFVAVLCYLVMNLDLVRHWVFVFPESLLLVLAATLALGRYSGYRLVELPRFRVLAGQTTDVRTRQGAEAQRRAGDQRPERPGTFWNTTNGGTIPLVDDKALTKAGSAEAQGRGARISIRHDRNPAAGRARCPILLAGPMRISSSSPRMAARGKGILVITGRTDRAVPQGGRRAGRRRRSQIPGHQYPERHLQPGRPAGQGVDRIPGEVRSRVRRLSPIAACRDVRIIIFKGVPVMAMVRLPTRMSDGKANLHRGCIGAGIRYRDRIHAHRSVEKHHRHRAPGYR